MYGIQIEYQMEVKHAGIFRHPPTFSFVGLLLQRRLVDALIPGGFIDLEKGSKREPL